ncbi:DNA-3-methyladenine glycosylase [Nocardioides sp.]|uniref:DNA-3-methyladenine glycosylase family protein n=1 Tax=Nocardioides sp. TaxID=35761 RepID=UPI00273493EE|nr:DNA-3-methyladenine glycosylase 2 family protein [Nocardioides sp.]MDP3893553.1 DNA-3-methyladenine glycosylase 2 family protein [Nocardioides sp.]
MSGQVREWRPDWPCPVAAVLRVHRRGPGDPTYRIDKAGRHWLGLRTPEGTATLRVEALTDDGLVRAIAWGAGQHWALDGLPALLGAEDDPSGFEPRHPMLADAQRRHPHWRISRTTRVFEALLPAVIEQKVTGQEAFAGFRALVRRHGEPAPGPAADVDLRLQPSPDVVAAIPSWEWLRLHIDPARSRTLVGAARVAGSLERLGGVDHNEGDGRLRSLPGIGVWTSAETRVRACGDPDAVSFGDYHVAKDIGWTLVGEEIDDDALAELLEPWRPHRYRVQALLAMTGRHRPRRGPRMAPRTHLPR